MRKKHVVLQRIDHTGNDKPDTERFQRCLQNGLLLALKELGYLSESQYRHAAERIKDS